MISKYAPTRNRFGAVRACMMSARVKPRYLWLRLSIVLGLGLGLLLLVQSILTYRHVTDGLLRQEAQRSVDRRVDSIGRAARLTKSRDPATLTPVLHELVHEAPQEIAWIRIVNIRGKAISESEAINLAPVYERGEPGRLVENRNRHLVEKMTPSGVVLIALAPLRLAPPPFARPHDDPSSRIAEIGAEENRPEAHGHEGRGDGRGEGRGGPHPQPAFVEVAVYLNGVSPNFGLLREYLIVSCSAAFALMAAVVVIGLRFPHYMRSKRVEEELSLARRVQLDLFPTDNSLSGKLPFAAKCVPAWQVGGDLYDVFDTDDGEIALVLGDVSGKGLPAALLMGVVQGAVRASSGSGIAVNHEQAAERLNQLLCMKTARERFVSLFWCYFDRQASVLRYINAGHLPPLLIRRSGGATEIIRLDEGGPVLGLLPGARYTQVKVSVNPGDLLVAYSDGILEAENGRGEEFGEDGLIASITKRADTAPGDICAAVLEDVRSFLGAALPHDDQTLLIVRLDRARVFPAAEPVTAEAAVHRQAVQG